MNNILNIFIVFLLISCNNDNGKNKTSTNNYNPDFRFQKNNKNTIDNNDIYVMFLQGPQQGELLNKIQDYGLKQIKSQYMFLFNKNENKIIGHIKYSYRIGCRPGNVDEDDKTLETIKSKIKNTIPIWEIKIKENYQQKGYFKRMFLFFLSHFEQNTLFDLMATSANKKNMPNKVLINIYKNFGFKIANDIDNGMYYFKKSNTIQYKNNNFNKENVKIEVKSK